MKLTLETLLNNSGLRILVESKDVPLSLQFQLISVVEILKNAEKVKTNYLKETANKLDLTPDNQGFIKFPEKKLPEIYEKLRDLVSEEVEVNLTIKAEDIKDIRWSVNDLLSLKPLITDWNSFLVDLETISKNSA